MYVHIYIYVCIYCVIHIARAYTKNARPQQDAELPEGAMERGREIYILYIYIVITTITIVYVHQLIDIQAAPPCRVNST